MKIKNFQEFLNERAVSSDDVMHNEKNTGVVIQQYKRSGKDHVNIVLFDFKAKSVEGYISIERFGNDDVYILSHSYGVDKHGPLMYDLALSAVSPVSIIPDRIIRPRALKIWEYFIEKRNDVIKKDLPEDHEWYAKEYDVDVEKDHLKDPAVLSVINKSYSIKEPIQYFHELVKRGEQFMEEHKMKAGEIVKQAESDFKKKYDSEF